MKTISIQVKPRSRVSTLEEGPDGTWIARLKAPPVDGKANQELIEVVARYFDRSKGAISIKSGTTGRKKWVQIFPEDGK